MPTPNCWLEPDTRRLYAQTLAATEAAGPQEVPRAEKKCFPVCNPVECRRQNVCEPMADANKVPHSFRRRVSRLLRRTALVSSSVGSDAARSAFRQNFHMWELFLYCTKHTGKELISENGLLPGVLLLLSVQNGRYHGRKRGVEFDFALRHKGCAK